MYYAATKKLCQDVFCRWKLEAGDNVLDIGSLPIASSTGAQEEGEWHVRFNSDRKG
jgi:hypothetical protein